MLDGFGQAVLVTIMFAIVAVAVFESGRASVRKAHTLCWCGHVRSTIFRFGGHVRPMDWDSKLYVEGAQYGPGQCRECECTRFRPKA